MISWEFSALDDDAYICGGLQSNGRTRVNTRITPFFWFTDIHVLYLRARSRAYTADLRLNVCNCRHVDPSLAAQCCWFSHWGIVLLMWTLKILQQNLYHPRPYTSWNCKLPNSGQDNHNTQLDNDGVTGGNFRWHEWYISFYCFQKKAPQKWLSSFPDFFAQRRFIGLGSVF